MTKKSRMRRFVQAAEPLPTQLPLVHSTDAYRFVDMAEEDAITPQACSVFTGERLTYFFYGRPSFRPNAQEEPTGLDHYLPVCLILRPDFALQIKRIFPFDSGAFHHSFYAAYFHKLMALQDFELTPSPETPGRLVSRFYGSNAAYLYSKDPKLEDIDPEEFEARSYLELISARGGNAIDSRGAGVEIQTQEAIKLTEAVEAVIVPSTFEASASAGSLRDHGVEVIPYSVVSRMRPMEYAGSLTEVCMAYYRRKGILGEAVG